MKLFFDYCGGQIPVCLVQRRGNRRLRLSVEQGRIRLGAPPHTPQRLLDDFLHRYRQWIADRLRACAALPVQEFGDGARHPYLGGDIILHLHHGHSSELCADRLYLRSRSRRREHVAAALNRWYRQRALHYLSARTVQLAAQTPWIAAPPPVKIRRMKRQWGNCGQSGTLTFNSHLIKAAPPLIDHVILHELCHLCEFNHSPRFYALLDALDPERREKEAQLQALAAHYLR